ncbi:MAG: hypothetical protein J0H98_07235 [Solirubrobacterales bacterium]|nr:hypothetical protein [Solirubrobacterales bacterium]
MRALLLIALTVIVSRSVLDPEAGVSLLQGAVLIGIGFVAINWLFPKRGISLTTLIAFHLITRRRKEKRHATRQSPARSHRHQARDTRPARHRRAA